MKTRIAQYTFNPSAKQITFTGLSSITLDGVLLITNVLNNTIIYNFADSTMGGTVSGNILTLAYNTTGMGATDPLMIYYDDVTTPANNDVLTLLKRMVKLLESQGTVDVNARQRIAVETMPTVAVTLATAPSTPIVSANVAATGIWPTVANPFTLSGANIAPVAIMEGPVDQRWRIIDAARTSFAVGIRAKLT